MIDLAAPDALRALLANGTDDEVHAMLNDFPRLKNMHDSRPEHGEPRMRQFKTLLGDSALYERLCNLVSQHHTWNGLQ